MVSEKKSDSVLVFNQFAQPLSSGGGTRHVEMFNILREWDAEILASQWSYFDQVLLEPEGIFTPVWTSRYSGNGVSRILNWLSYSAVALGRGLLRKPTVVYGSSPQMGAALVGWMVAKARRAGFVLEIRDLWPHILAESGMLPETSRVYRTLKVLERFLYRQADQIVVLADGSSDFICAEGISRDKIVFIPNGADPSDFEVAVDRDVLREKFGFNDFSIVYAGAHGPANGLDLVLAAAERIGPDQGISFHLFGDGPSKAGLVEAVGTRGISNVHFHNPVAKTAIAEVFKAADAGLHSLADHELFKKGVSPNKLYDYMAAGLPVITNTGGDVAAMVEEAESGLTPAPDGIDGAALALAAMSADERSQFGSNGISWMWANRSRRAMSDRLEDTLNSARR